MGRSKAIKAWLSGIFGGGIRAIEWLLNADFSDTQAAPIPRTSEPTGAVKVTDTGSRASIASSKLSINLSSGVTWGDPGLWDNTPRTRAAGLAVLSALKHITSTKRSMVGFDTAQAGTIDEHSLHRDSSGTYAAKYGATSLTLPNTFVANTEYIECIILRSAGAFYLVKGGAYTEWTLLFLNTIGSTASLYPGITPGDAINHSMEFDYLRCRQLPAPFSSDYGLATLHQVNPVAETEYEGEADGIFDLTFTLPAGWANTQWAGISFRYVDANNHWRVVAYNAAGSGRLFLTSIVSGVVVDRSVVDSVFSAGGTYTIRVISQGSKHNVYTLSGTTWTKRGAEVDVVTPMDAEKTTLAHVGNGTGYTFSALDAWPRTLSAAQATELDRVEDVTWLLRDDFTTAAAAGQIVRRPVVPGPGTLIKLLDTGDRGSLASGSLRLTGNASYTDPKYYLTPHTRAAGMALLFGGSVVTGQYLIGLAYQATVSGGLSDWEVALNVQGTLLNSWGVDSNPTIALAMADGVSYSWAIVEKASGHYILVKGGAFTNWTLLWSSVAGAHATIYPMVNVFGTGPLTVSDMRVRALPAPFNTDYGLATLTTTTFTQSLGAELLTNGDFSAWTGDNPNGWTVSGEVGSDPMVTQVAPGGGAGTGAARFYASTGVAAPQLTQAALIPGELCEAYAVLSAYTSGSLQWTDNWGTWPLSSQSGVSTRYLVARTGNNTVLALPVNTAHDFVLDTISVKNIIRNAAQTATADGIFDFEFTVPASPFAGQAIHLLYRIEASGDEFYDCWDAYLERAASDWTFKLDSISAGTRTNRLSVTGITGSHDTIRVICAGSLHDCYTKSGTSWTKRGSQVNISHLNTATLINTVYSSAATAGRLTAWPRSLSAGLAAELEKV